MLNGALAKRMLRTVDPGNAVKSLVEQRNQFVAALDERDAQYIAAPAHQCDKRNLRQLHQRVSDGAQVRRRVDADPEVRDDGITQLLDIEDRCGPYDVLRQQTSAPRPNGALVDAQQPRHRPIADSGIFRQAVDDLGIQLIAEVCGEWPGLALEL